jgi:hypothetical protein
MLGPSRAAQIVGLKAYDPADPTSLSQARIGGVDDLRALLVRIGTDAVWRAPSRDVARRWETRGGKVWVGEWTRGMSYRMIQGGLCRDGMVCHEVSRSEVLAF